MKMITHRKRRKNGCNQYEVRDHLDRYVGWLSREYAPWTTLSGKIPAYQWQLELDWDYTKIRLDDKCFPSFHKAREWIEDNVT
jgi:hypothetical protein